VPLGLDRFAAAVGASGDIDALALVPGVVTHESATVPGAKCILPADVPGARAALGDYVPITDVFTAVLGEGGDLKWPDQPDVDAAILGYLRSKGYNVITLAGMPRVPSDALVDDTLEDLIDVREANLGVTQAAYAAGVGVSEEDVGRLIAAGALPATVSAGSMPGTVQAVMARLEPLANIMTEAADFVEQLRGKGFVIVHVAPPAAAGAAGGAGGVSEWRYLKPLDHDGNPVEDDALLDAVCDLCNET